MSCSKKMYLNNVLGFVRILNPGGNGAIKPVKANSGSLYPSGMS
jgi:hypothetical protein